MPLPASTASQRCQPPTRTTKATATIEPQTYDGAHTSDSSENRPMPSSDPTRSQRYAVSGGSRPKHRPTTSAGPARMKALRTNTTGRISQAGGPVVSSAVKKMTSAPERSTDTGKTSTATTSSASTTGVHGSTDQLFREMRKPTPIPRKDPSRTKLVK